jgi:hypothetical protein
MSNIVEKELVWNIDIGLQIAESVCIFLSPIEPSFFNSFKCYVWEKSVHEKKGFIIAKRLLRPIVAECTL